jgi:hypothetical protein
MGGVGNLHLAGVTPTQAMVSYTAPDAGPCRLELSESASFTPVVFDTDAAKYANSNLDLSRPNTIVSGLSRTAVFGKQRMDLALDGNWYSRALAADAKLFLRVGCGAGFTDTATLSFATPTPALGTTHGMTYQSDASAPGAYITPFYSYTDRNQEIVDPQTGVKVKRVNLPRDQNRDTGDLSFTAVEQGTGWTNPDSLLSNFDAGAYAGYGGTSQDWLYLRVNIAASGWGAQLNEVPLPDYLRLTLSAYCAGANCANAADRVVDIQQTYDGVTFGPTQTVTVANGGEANVSLCGAGGATCTAGAFWGLPTPERQALRWSSGFLVNSSPSVTVSFTQAGDCAQLRAGDAIYVAGNNMTVVSLDCMAGAAVLNFAVNLAAPGGMTGWPFAYAVGWQDNAKLGFRIRKHSTNPNAEIRVQYASLYVGRSDRGPTTSAGFSDRCQEMLTSNGNLLCNFPGRLYSINPVTGEVHSMGSTFGTGGAAVVPILIGETPGNGNVLWDPLISRRVWAGASESATGKPVILRCDITQDDTVDNPWPDGPAGLQLAATTCVNMTPSAGGFDIRTMVAACSAAGPCGPGYNVNLYGNWAVVSLIGNYLFLAANRGSQDSYAYVAVFDIGNGSPLGSGGTGSIVAGNYLHKMASSLAQNKSLRWTSLHNLFHPIDAPGWMAWGPTAILKNDGGPGSNTFYVKLDTALPAVAAGTQQEINITTTWNPVWGTQPAGYRVGDPVSDCIPGGCVNADDETGDFWRGALKAGDFCRIVNGANVEYLQFVAVTSAASVRVKRGIGAAPPDNYDVSFYAPKAWPVGQQCVMTGANANFRVDPALSFSGVAWNFLASRDGTDISAFRYTAFPGGGHQSIRNFYSTAGPEFMAYRSAGGLSGAPSLDLTPTDPGATNISRPPVFGGQSTVNAGECTEGHPSVGLVSGNRLRALDSHPMLGGEGCFNTLTSASPATLVSWPIYKFRPNLHPKHFDTIAFAGDKLLRNVSGPGSVVTGAPSDQWTVCHALVNGECFAGSVAGDVYFSAPNLRPGLRYCTNLSILVDDVCIGDMPYAAGKMVEYNTPALLDAPPFPAGMPTPAMRELTGVFSRYKVTPGTHNIKLLPGGLFGYYGSAGGPRTDSYLVKVPRNWEPDSVGRATFAGVPITLSSVPGGVSRVLIKFGFDENFRCSQNRNEGCYAAAAGVTEANPFLWETELTGSSGVACASGCTVTIPALADRVVFYQVVYRDAGGGVVFRSEVRSAVPGN